MNTSPIPLSLAARRFGLPTRWLRREVEAGRIPALIADRAILIDPETLAVALSHRARGGKSDGGAK